MDLLNSFRAESLRSNQSVWFGHYTTSTIVSPAPGVRDMMRYEAAKPVLNRLDGAKLMVPSCHGANVQYAGVHEDDTKNSDAK